MQILSQKTNQYQLTPTPKLDTWDTSNKTVFWIHTEQQQWQISNTGTMPMKMKRTYALSTMRCMKEKKKSALGKFDWLIDWL